MLTKLTFLVKLFLERNHIVWKKNYNDDMDIANFLVSKSLQDIFCCLTEKINSERFGSS